MGVIPAVYEGSKRRSFDVLYLVMTECFSHSRRAIKMAFCDKLSH